MYSQLLSGSLWVQSWKEEEIVHLVLVSSGFDPIKFSFIYLLGTQIFRKEQHFPSTRQQNFPPHKLIHGGKSDLHKTCVTAYVAATCIQALQNLTTLKVHIIPNGFGLKLNVNDGL